MVKDRSDSERGNHGSTMKDESDDASHHERTLLPRRLHLAPFVAKGSVTLLYNILGLINKADELV